MSLVPITVRDAKGTPAQAELFACEECGSTRFLIFRLAGQDHPHLQCDSCATSYCPLGTCEDPGSAAEAINA